MPPSLLLSLSLSVCRPGHSHTCKCFPVLVDIERVIPNYPHLADYKYQGYIT